MYGGPYSTNTYNSCTYFLTIVDDFTCCTWLYLMRQKSDSVTYIWQFVEYVETQLSKKILCIRFDNAKELSKGVILQFYLSKGIIRQKSCPDTPQQNGVVEPKHQHLLETARALHF